LDKIRLRARHRKQRFVGDKVPGKPAGIFFVATSGETPCGKVNAGARRHVQAACHAAATSINLITAFIPSA
jgi:hypothetical protein